jgi:type II secretory pathway component PulL
MSLSEKVFEALRSTILLNERVALLDGRLGKLDDIARDLHERIIRLETKDADIQSVDRRLTRLETIFEMVQGNLQSPRQTPPKKIKR